MCIRDRSSEIIKPEFDKILDSLNVKGSVLIYDLKNDIYYSNNFSWAKMGAVSYTHLDVYKRQH